MSTQTVPNMSSVVFEEQFRCCICLDVYTDPVSIPCGHNFCLDCIEGFWDMKEQSECPLCKETFRNRPDLRINRGFAGVIEFFKRPLSAHDEEDVDAVDPPAVQISDGDGVPCDICNGDKAPSVKSCLVCQVSYCDVHLTPHLREPALQRHQLTDPATFPTSHLCRNHNKPLTMFCKTDQMPMCTKCVERSHKSHGVVPMNQASKKVKSSVKVTKANIQQMIQARLKKMDEIKTSVDLSKGFQSLSKLLPTRKLSEVTVHSNNCMGAVRRTVNKLMDICQEVINKLSAEEANNLKQYAVDVILDPNTASGWLVLSSDGKKVGDKTDWDLGVARESINRKGAITVRPDSGYWSICRRKGGSLNACTTPSTALHLQQTPDRVAIFLDYEEGSVSFYDAGTNAHIYTYSGCTFTEP
ncbi:hypothetical protein INR49_002450, partial [Caranx melampygus]